MLLLRRHWRHDATDLDILQSELRAPGLVVVHEVVRNGSHVPEPVLPVGWGRAVILLSGEGAVLHGQTREKTRLDVGVLYARDEWLAVESSPFADILTLAWRTGPGSDATRERIDATKESAARRLAELMSSESSLSTSISDALSSVAEEIVPSALVRAALREEPSQQMMAVARVVERYCVQLDRNPTNEDLARDLGVTPKRASDLAVEYFRRYHATVDGWREYLNRLRLELAMSALLAGRLQVREVAEWLGFGAASSLNHAFKRAGLPEPTSFLGRAER